MTQFKLVKDGDSIRKHDTEVLKQAVFSLTDNDDSFVVLEPKCPIDNSIYLQAVCQEDLYVAEIHFVFDSGKEEKHYSRVFETKQDLYEVFAQYYIQSKIPDLKEWNDDSLSTTGEEDDEMVKLYKKINGEITYFEVWINDDGLTIHTGTLGDTGSTEDIAFKEEIDAAAQISMKKYIAEAKNSGYTEFEDLAEFILQYSYSENDEPERLIDKKDRVESLLNNCLGWTGNGHCDGGDCGSGTLNIFCYVVNKDIALETVLELLRDEELTDNLKIAYLNNLTEEYELLYPESGNFSLL